MLSHLLKLTLVTYRQNQPVAQYLKFIETCAKAGVTSVQLREKNEVSDDFLRGFGRDLKALLSPYAIPLIVNDRVDIACQIDAAGVHVGEGDWDVKDARARIGDGKWLGYSVYSEADVAKAQHLPVDYLGVTTFTTKTKPDLSNVWGLDGLKNVVALSEYPIVGVGGVNVDNVASVMEQGVAGVAVIGAIHDAKDPATVIKELLIATAPLPKPGFHR